MSITLVVDGDEYSGFIGATVVLSLIDLCNTFSFEATAADGVPLPFKGGETCQVFVSGELVLTGNIELITIDGSGDDHRITIQGRDKCGDLLDSMISGEIDEIQGSISLKRICELVIEDLGLDIKVIDNVNPPLFEDLIDLSSPEPAQGAFDYLETLARKKQVLLSSNSEGNIVIQQSSKIVAEGAFIHHRVGDPEGLNNVLEYASSRDQTGRYNVYKVAGSLSLPATALGQIGLSSDYMSSQLSLVRDVAIRKGRQFVLVDESIIPSGDGKVRARWQRDIDRARGTSYSVTIHGHEHQGGKLWSENELVSVLSEYAGINDQMMVDQVQFDQSPGTNTVLTLIDKNAYALSLSEPTEDDFGIFR